VLKKPKLFIGSSTEALDFAYAVQEGLERDADCTVWTQGVFGLSRGTLAELRRNLTLFDCAAFIFAPDDKIVFRGRKGSAVRDNVLFELGLFFGWLGESRVYVIAPYDIEDLRIPSDFLGVTLATYRANRNDGSLVAVLGSACNQIRRELKSLTLRGSRDLRVPTKVGFFSDYISDFPDLLNKSKLVVLYFIHGRRWRENHIDKIVEFLGRTGTRLTVFLPNMRKRGLINAIQEHFEDGPSIPGLIKEAFDHFRNLRKRFPTKVIIRSFDTYPTYSFYKFDDKIVVAAYPTTPRRKDVPTVCLDVSHPYAQFVLEDLKKLSNSGSHSIKSSGK